jgi:uncharacterized membrane protein
MNDPDHPRRRLPRPVRVVRARPRLFLSAVIGLVVVAALPTEWKLTTRMLIGWDVGIALYLMAAYGTMARADIHHIRRQSALQDEGRIAILVLTVTAALASIAAIIVELAATPGGGREPIRLLLATITIVLSWGFIHTIFALHYAHEFHAEHRNGGGLAFPGNEDPDYWDFVYFSFVIGMTSQVSDVAVTSKAIRQTVAAHGIVSFVFNVALLALTVNIAASAI